MRIAHFSDLHVLALDGVKGHRFLNKRFTGWVNLKVKRSHKHRPGHVRAVSREIARAGVDHVVITGDLTNLALETEFEAVRALLEEELGLAGSQISIVPGNHDLYTRGALRSKRFSTYFAPFVESDLPDLAAALPLGPFPFVRLRGPLAIIGLSSAVPRPPLVASGELGKLQLAAVARILAHPEVQKRTPIVALHHPIHNPPSSLKTVVEGLWDARQLIEALGPVTHGLVLHGHLHVRRQTPLSTRAGEMLSIGATSASLHSEEEARMAGFNLYSFDDGGKLTEVDARIYDPATETFHRGVVPKVA